MTRLLIGICVAIIHYTIKYNQGSLTRGYHVLFLAKVDYNPNSVGEVYALSVLLWKQLYSLDHVCNFMITCITRIKDQRN